ncbi:MAG: acyl carrier protein [Cyanobacteria bacterium P01_C01_bin.118]
MTTTQPIPTQPQPSRNYQRVIQTYISDVLLNGRMQVDADDDLLVGEIIDSLGMMQLVAFIEETFAIRVPLEDITIQNFRTVEAMDEYLTGKAGHG